MLSYTSLHWGTKPNHIDNVTCAKGSAKSIGKLRACSYAAVKANKSDIYRHEFEGDTHLLKADPRGEYKLTGCPKDVIAIGRALDFELSNNERIIIGGISWFVTDKNGKHVWLVGQQIPYGIEYSLIGPFVTNNGIEG